MYLYFVNTKQHKTKQKAQANLVKVCLNQVSIFLSRPHSHAYSKHATTDAPWKEGLTPAHRTAGSVILFSGMPQYS